MGPEFVLMLLIFAAAGVFIVALYIRYRRRELQHKERLAAIEKGVALPELADVEAGPRIYLLRGMIWLFLGIALSVFLLAVSVSTHHPKSIGERFREARMVEEMGGSPEQVRQVQNDIAPQEDFPIAVSLIGLVPVGVGLAYLVFYRAEATAKQQ